MKRVFYILLFVFAYSLSAVAQIELPDKVSAFLPDCLKERLITERSLSKISKANGYGQNASTGEKKFWNVFSDRADNLVYSQPAKSSSVVTKLEFNQRVRIAQIKSGFALVYEEPNIGLGYPNISQDAKAKGALGWVPMENLLLWHSCPANDHGILNKALLVLNLNKAGGGDIEFMCKNPETKVGAENIESTIDFYFVMKKDPKTGLVLLASQSSMEGDSDQVLYGWVDSSSYTPWNQRSCLEYNWDPITIEDHLKGKTASFYEDKELTVLASPGCKYGENQGGSLDTPYRIDGHRLRMPIHDNDSNNDDLYKITYFASPDGSYNIEEAAKLEEERNRLIDNAVKNTKNVNLIVVADGTQSMDKHFKVLHSAIVEACKRYVSDKYKLRLGLVIYRDYADKEHLCDVVPLTTVDDPRLTEFFRTGGPYGITSTRGDDYSEALYVGLNAALNAEKMRYTKEESNLLLVVGDCGNRWDDKRDPDLDKIKKKMLENNINLISFQVHNEDRPGVDAWLDFNLQMTDLILSNVEMKYSETGQSGEFVESTDGNGYDFHVKEGSAYYVASMRNPQLGETMPIIELENLIAKNVEVFSGAIGKQLNALINGYKVNKDSSSVGAQRFDENFLKGKLGSERFEVLRAASTLCALSGYTLKKDPASGADFYKPVIFIEKAEFEKMLNQFRKVYDATRGSDEREAYIGAMKQLLNSMVPDMTPEEMNKLGNTYITNLVAGLNVSTQALQDRSLEDIGDPNVVKPQEFKRIVSSFNRKFEILDNIYRSSYDYVFTANNQTYYWIPVEELP
ncbi:MAG: hypothetical protein J6V23_05275 [Bacteroidaceae bacterium]|nr:hypothetical protein [Bacteroidaceae bacterium]